MEERAQLYREAIRGADAVRVKYDITGPRLGLQQMRAIYRDQKIELTYWPHKLKVLRGVYINDEDEASVMVDGSLPDDPKLFTLAHELKHHLIDHQACSTIEGDLEAREIAAEVFAAHLLLPEVLFTQGLEERGIVRGVSSDDEVRAAIIDFKLDSRTTLSFTGLAKRAERLGYASARGALLDTKWKKLRDEMYGDKYYIRSHRALSSTHH